ncbi:MAG: dienelactone hydrolase family protein [Pseudomonadota bacterium]
MAVKETYLDYEYNGATYQAFMAYPESGSELPGVLVSHAWAGRGEFEEKAARWLAGLGYVGFALDMYGKGIRGTSVEENSALMTPLLEDRKELLARISAALDTLRAQPMVDSNRCGAMGFCFGGLCVLDLARSGSDALGVVSVHGLFNPPEGTAAAADISSKILCLHGYDDPMAPPESVLGLATELSAASADWQLHAYGGTLHSFTNPQANDPDMGTVYSPVADARAHRSIENFFEEVFSD